MKLGLSALLLIALMVLMAPSSISSQTAHAHQPTPNVVHVALTGADVAGCGSAAVPCASVQFAVDGAAAGDELRIAAGVFAGVSARANTTQTVYVDKDLTLRGGYTVTNWNVSDPTLNPTVLDAQQAGRVVFINNAAVTLANLMLRNGSITGTGTLCPGAGCGGGIYATGVLTLTSVRVLFNMARWHGGGLFAINATLINTLLQGNTSTDRQGGGAWVSQEAALNNAQFINNSAAAEGGGLHANSSAHLTNSYFFHNVAVRNGGGAHIVGTAHITTSQFLSNTALNGGGLYVREDATIFGATFLDNAASRDGGGMYLVADANLASSQILSNTALGEGGGLKANGAVTVTGDLFEGNRCTAVDCVGGGLSAGNLVLNGARLINNTATAAGGGAYAGGSATVLGGRFEANRCTSPGCWGGGLHGPNLAITATMFIANNAVRGGGLSHNFGAGRVVNALFARNAASAGAALYFDSPDGAEILHTTIASPTLGAESAIHITTGTLSVTNTIVASYSVGISSPVGALSADYNLFFGNGVDRIGVGAGTHDVQGNPAFVNPLADDYHLTGMSAAMDMGAPSSVLRDFEGDSRPVGTAADSGFDEAAPVRDLLLLHDPLTPTLGVPVLFTATSAGGAVHNYMWQIDGVVVLMGTRSDLTHTFTTGGSHTVVVTATNAINSLTVGRTFNFVRAVYVPMVAR
jgi:hypothetical protein